MNRFATWKRSLSAPEQQLIDYAINAVIFAALNAIFILLFDERPITFARIALSGILLSLLLTSPARALTWNQLGSIFRKKQRSESR
ncbi:MAG TPA: hypothetical protein VLA58_01695 [Chitinophagaceae bacterium]|nr:hypothetical protein [Chitinophagaceae bacterium]